MCNTPYYVFYVLQNKCFVLEYPQKYFIIYGRRFLLTFLENVRKVFFMNVHSLLDKVIHTLAGIGIFSVFIFSCLSIAINIASPHTYHVTDLLDNWVDENGNSFSLNSFHTDSISDPQTQSVICTLDSTSNDMALLFRSRNMFVDIYVNDILVSEDDREQSVIFGTSPGSRWHMVALDSSNPSITIRLEGTPCYTNVNGLIDLSWVKKYASIKSLLFIGIPGEEGASALAGILTGEINPSGKLAVTIAEHYEDYPSADHFSWDKEHLENILDYESYGLSSEENGSTGFTKSPVIVYWEDIYTGYRYFDTFGKQVLYPFGYGLSYTAFAISDALVKKQNGGILVTADVKNIGEMSGKEVIQIYLSKVYPAEGVERPYQELKGFEKTSDLAPGEKEQVKIWIPWRELAVYDEERAAWVIESGDYLLKMGKSSRDTFTVGMVCLRDTVLTEQCANRLTISGCNRGKLSFLTQKDCTGCQPEDVYEKKPDGGVTETEVISVTEEDILAGGESIQAEKEAQQSLPELSIEELASLCVGYGPGTPFAAVGDRTDPSAIFDADGNPLTINSHPTGYPGYVSPAIAEKGIKSIFYKDGPAGIGGIAWPTEMLIACSFDKKMWQMFGDAVGKECEEQQVNVWLAPAVNLHRNPLCGRNFEYFSEDPYLTGVCACEITKGVQNDRPVIVCPKHFAANEQETFRRGNAGKNVDAVDSILTERALREQYLKPFEMLVKDAGIACIMTSFNKINGSFSGGSHDLCTQILREEWGFEGAVVTDWGDMDMVVDGADAVAAGNDIVMPGGPPVIRQILKGYEEGRVTREELEQAVRHLLIMIKRIRLAD